MSYARLSRRPLLFESFTGLEITEFDIISKEIESKFYEHERKRLVTDQVILMIQVKQEFMSVRR